MPTMTIPAAQRNALALEHGINEAYLYQCMTGRRQMDAAEARRLHTATGGVLAVWHLRPLDWHRIWPELIGADGAPEVVEAARAA